MNLKVRIWAQLISAIGELPIGKSRKLAHSFEMLSNNKNAASSFRTSGIRNI